MKHLWLILAASSFTSFSFGDSVIAKNKINLATSNNKVKTHLVQNTNNNPQTAEEYIERGISRLNSEPPQTDKAIAEATIQLADLFGWYNLNLEKISKIKTKLLNFEA